ncbi:hypothetical protein Hsw_3707 [Hymenobacter swuensis DY53]|uniref:Uncharacterized protein n=1 Tax=Hymenobacter swuensis DY53 TaxID=1227739 RepID=W8F5I7_9BACT|nr:hypothetical protein Hsw_3707 [Hymenobacter swuensis DY53]
MVPTSGTRQPHRILTALHPAFFGGFDVIPASLRQAFSSGLRSFFRYPNAF